MGLHSWVWVVNYWAITRRLEFNLTFEQQVLGIQPFLCVLHHFVVDLALFFGGRGLLVLRFVLVQLLQHLRELLDLRLVHILAEGVGFGLFFFRVLGCLFGFFVGVLLLALELCSRLGELFDCLLLVLIGFLQFLVFFSDF